MGYLMSTGCCEQLKSEICGPKRAKSRVGSKFETDLYEAEIGCIPVPAPAPVARCNAGGALAVPSNGQCPGMCRFLCASGWWAGSCQGPPALRRNLLYSNSHSPLVAPVCWCGWPAKRGGHADGGDLGRLRFLCGAVAWCLRAPRSGTFQCLVGSGFV